jgi:hypothetical protein
MKTDADCWLDLAHRLGIEIIAPFNLELSGVRVKFTALLPQFGAPAGMVVDADWSNIDPHQSSLLAAGYGFSCVGPGDPTDLDDPEQMAATREMLADWGWSGASPKPDWLAE